MNYFSNTRNRWKKTLVLIGGNSDLGKAIVDKFSHTYLRKWKVLSIDVTENPKATRNFLLDPNHSPTPENMESLHKQVTDLSDELDAVIDISQVENINPDLTLSSPEIFEEFELLRKKKLNSVLLATNLSSHYLAPNGYVAISCNMEAFRNQGLIPLHTEKEKLKKIYLKTNFLDVAVQRTVL